MENELVRYGEITAPHQSEVVMLRGKGCFYKKCSFCDYHLDKSSNEIENYQLNKTILDKVSGKYGELEVICSGSIQELDDQTINYIKEVCLKKGINKLSLECHWKYHHTFDKFKQFFKEIDIAFRIGIETFDINYREQFLKKGMGNVDVESVVKYFDYCNLMVGIEGQTKKQILNDILIANKYFKRICIGVFEENSTKLKSDKQLIEWFKEEVAEELKKSLKFQILLSGDDYPLGVK